MVNTKQPKNKILKPNKSNFNVSIVIYGKPPNETVRLIETMQSIADIVFVIDNTPESIGEEYFLRKSSHNIENLCYIPTGKNLGYGKGHNVAIKESLKNGVPYHFVLNPDIVVSGTAISEICHFLKMNPAVGLCMPRVLSPDGTTQELAKRCPTPWQVLVRIALRAIGVTRNVYGAKPYLGAAEPFWAPIVSGCFMALRTQALRTVGSFDEQYFMYVEDYDLSRRIAMKYDVVALARPAVIHGYAKESGNNLFLTWQHLRSWILYFKKFGFFFDKDRHLLNKKIKKYEFQYTEAL